MKISVFILLVISYLCGINMDLVAATIVEGTNTISLSPTVLTALFEEGRTNNSGLRVTEARVTASQFGTETVRIWDCLLYTSDAADDIL
jgi:hypothetical protein